mmetsp:Transcript_8244/g.21357  ORF Transcript_8244/g.21357 Transcript_8244/m.21357 type:complete len:88 (+) Transcript_8244:116-379(+)
MSQVKILVEERLSQIKLTKDARLVDKAMAFCEGDPEKLSIITAADLGFQTEAVAAALRRSSSGPSSPVSQTHDIEPYDHYVVAEHFM